MFMFWSVFLKWISQDVNDVNQMIILGFSVVDEQNS